MKNKLLLSFSLIGLFASCSDEITNLNTDIKNPTTSNPTYLFTNAEKAMMDQVSSTSVNRNVFRLFAQQWTECQYPQETQYDITGRNIPDTHWAIYYRDVLRDFKESKDYLLKEVYIGTADEIATAEELRKNKLAIIEILTAYSYSILVDTFGDVPYTEALDILEHPQPKYTDGLTIYKDLITKLTIASATLESSTKDSFGKADLIYSGNTGKWAKFANSLRLRLAVNLYDTDATYANTEITSAKNAGLISSNADNTNMTYTSSRPNTNPLYEDLVASGRKDFVAANTFVNKLNELADPRRAKYFETVSGVYKGGIYGAKNNYSSFSPTSVSFRNPTYPGTIFDFSEVEFLLAEVDARNNNHINAQLHYNNAIAASMESWGITPAAAISYAQQANVIYDSANWKKSIGEQAWIALHNRGLEAWSSYRRLDFPVLTVPAVTYGNIKTVPTRFSYPRTEQTLNTTNMNAAVTAQGWSDNLLTDKIFWDKF